MLHRQLETPCVGLQVISHFILGRERIATRRKPEPRKAGVTSRSKKPERVPALAPGIARALMSVQDQEREAALGEIVADGESGLAAPDDQRLNANRILCHRPQNRAPSSVSHRMKYAFPQAPGHG